MKQSKETGTETMTVSEAPTSHEEFGASVIKAIGGDYATFGSAFDEIPADEIRIREFAYGKLGENSFVNYHISGNVRNFEHWVIAQ